MPKIEKRISVVHGEQEFTLYPIVDSNNVVIDTTTIPDGVSWDDYVLEHPEGSKGIDSNEFRVGDIWSGSDSAYVAPRPDTGTLQELINRERDRRIDAGIIYDFSAVTANAIGQVEFQTDLPSRENIAGAATFAFMAMSQGANNTNLRWASADEDFTWISADNNQIPMSAPLCLDFCAKAMSYKSALIKSARILKDTDPIPLDYASNNAYWPSKVINS